MSKVSSLQMLLLPLMMVITAMNASTLPKMVGSFLKIEIHKSDKRSELRTTILGEGDVIPLSGTAPLGNFEGISGELVPFSPLNACGEIIASNNTKRISSGELALSNTSGLSKTIALVGPGGCSIVEKILNVQRVPDVSGVLLFLGRHEKLTLVSGKVMSADVSIPGFLISNSLGQDLLTKIIKYRTPGKDDDEFDLPKSSSKGVQWSKTSDKWYKSTSEPWIRATIYYVNEKTSIRGILMMILFILCILLLAAFLGSLLLHFQLWRQQRREEQGRQVSNCDVIPNLPPITPEFVQSLPTIPYGSQQQPTADSDEKGKAPIEENMPIHWSNKVCPICLDDFEDKEVLVELPCVHQYHPTCITPWLLNRSPCCPLCKIDTRVGPSNALLIQMGKAPILPKQPSPGFFKYYSMHCWDLIYCCKRGREGMISEESG